MSIKKVIVLFKTHLDIGFTDFSKNVVNKYMNDFIPNALRVSKEVEELNCGAEFIWTTGSWLISEYLRTQETDKTKELERAICEGKICWHGLPFTTHTELMGSALFRYGLSLSANLDKKFAKTTIAAKMTDVPGHTKAIIPYLKKAGIEFLHIGVNPASAVPQVPGIFRWQAENGEFINVMYHNDYGKFSEIGNTGVAIYFAHTHDNCGAQSAEEIIKIFDDLHKELPEAEIVAGNLNDVALEVRKIEKNLPVITSEIGDTWIHGTGTDPKKVFWFRNLQKYWERMPEGEDKDTIARGLIMIPEHTWGLNVHTHLGDHENYNRDDFDKVRKNLGNFLKMESSWDEQRRYITDILNNVSDTIRNDVKNILCQYKRDNIMKGYFTNLPAGKDIELGSYTLAFNNQGEIIKLKKGETVISDKKHRLCSLVYEQFCEDDYKRFFTKYNRSEETWAYEDYTKPGMASGSECYSRFEPEYANVYQIKSGVLVRYKFSETAHKKMGCPLLFDLLISEKDGDLHFDLAWFCKPANRVAEAIWFGFRPIASNKKISKLGQLIDPKDVVYNGQRNLHSTDYGVVYDELQIESLDTALVSPKEPSLLDFTNTSPQDTDGIYFNLYNNVWGTNFPMWYDEDARFRFILHFN